MVTLLRRLACLLVGHDKLHIGFEQWERSPPWVVSCSRCGRTWITEGEYSWRTGIKSKERKP